MTPSVHLVDNGIGPYEFQGHRGVDVSLQPELDEILKLDVTGEKTEQIIRGRVSGGCDGEHSGRCTRACIPYEVDYIGRLKRVKVENGRRIAYYFIEQE